MGFHSLDIGKTALLAANYGIKVTGQNLSNINTAGYSRQVLSQSGAAYGGTHAKLAQLGSGVNINGIKRISNSIVEKNLRQATSGEQYYSGLNTTYTKIQSYFNEPTGNALSDSMTEFWNSMKDLASHVETIGNRTTTIEDAKTMAEQFSKTAISLREYRNDMNEEVVTSVREVNELINTIASLNGAIVDIESGGVSGVMANDLRDERGNQLRLLSELVGIDVVEEPNGAVNVSIGGRHLVYRTEVYEMAIKREKNGDLNCAIPVFARDQFPVRLDEGKLAAQVETRDVIVKSYIDELDQLAGTFTWEFNRIYSQGRGDDSFTSLTSLYSPTDPTVTLDQLNFRTNIPEGTFKIENGYLELILHNKTDGSEESVRVDIDLDGRLSPSGEPDMILYDPANPDASNSFVKRLQEAFDSKKPGAFTVSIDNQYKVTITSNSKDYGFCFGEDTSGVLAALGMNVFFTGHDAATMGVNEDVSKNPSMMAVSRSFSSGDNTNISELVSFSESKLARLGGQSGAEYYINIAGRLGGEAYRAYTMLNVKGDIYTSMFNQREELSGVSENEETLKLLAYQRAFQSASKYLGIVDQLYETLINL